MTLWPKLVTSAFFSGTTVNSFRRVFCCSACSKASYLWSLVLVYLVFLVLFYFVVPQQCFKSNFDLRLLFSACFYFPSSSPVLTDVFWDCLKVKMVTLGGISVTSSDNSRVGVPADSVFKHTCSHLRLSEPFEMPVSRVQSFPWKRKLLASNSLKQSEVVSC